MVLFKEAQILNERNISDRKYKDPRVGTNMINSRNRKTYMKQVSIIPINHLKTIST